MTLGHAEIYQNLQCSSKAQQREGDGGGGVELNIVKNKYKYLKIKN